MLRPIKIINHPEFGELKAIQWDGLTLPGEYEEFADFGYFEDDNGYDLESCDCDFQIELRKISRVRNGDWILKNKENKFTHVSESFFRTNLKPLETSV
jgi:hypothetical protein